MAQRILVAFDESPQARAALLHAFAQFPDAEIIVLHVNDPRDWSFGDSRSGFHSVEEFRQAQESAETLLEEAKAIAGEHQRKIKTVIETGQPSRGIVAYAEANDIDHIVLGSHGRRGLPRLLLGSVAELVSRRSPVPVTITGVENEEA